MHQVFISYSSKNKSIADAICQHLEFQGIRCWYAPRNISPGKDWVEAIMEAIGSAKIFLLIYSTDSNQSRQVQNEVAAAFNAGCTIVPFRVDDTAMASKMAYYLNNVHWLDAAHSPADKTFNELTSYIPALLGEPSSVPSVPATPVQRMEHFLMRASGGDNTVWLTLTLNANPKMIEHQVRGNVMLPNGTGIPRRVLVLTKLPSKAMEARAAGAEYAGGEELVEKITKNNWFDFDILVASPEIMGTVGRMSPLLSPRGLMPSPKAGTLTPNVASAVKEIKAGRVEFRMDFRKWVRCPIGKVSFGARKLLENMDALIRAVADNKPQIISEKFIQNCSVSTDDGAYIDFETEPYI